MNLNSFKGKVLRCKVDRPLIKSLIEMSNDINKSITFIPLNEHTVPTIITQYYESFRQIIEAIVIKNQLKILSYEALTVFLRDIGEDNIAKEFERIRKIRNGINYYGRKVLEEEVRYSSPRILKATKELKQKHLIGY